MSDKKKIETKDEIIGGVSETSGVNVEIASNLTISEDVIGIIAGLAARCIWYDFRTCWWN